jgi:hypothetical protein
VDALIRASPQQRISVGMMVVLAEPDQAGLDFSPP